jgi:hypothetical protein
MGKDWSTTLGPRAAPKPVNFRHVLDALDATDAALRRILVMPRLPKVQRDEIEQILEVTAPILIRVGRR